MQLARWARGAASRRHSAVKLVSQGPMSDPQASEGAARAAGSASAAGAQPRAPPLVVAIDGPAASGKGTIAKQLASQLGLAHIDTGLLYRRVGHAALAQRMPLDPSAEPQLAALAAHLPPLDAAPAAELRSEAAGQAASKVSALPGVRAALLDAQRRFAAAPPPPAKGAVLDGRDIGTVVCPDATAKLFVVASAEVRARRRLLEMQQAAAAPQAAAAGGQQGGGAVAAAAAAAAAAPPTYESVLASVKERDARDEARAAAPLVAAPDALVLDTSSLSIEEAAAAALAFVRDKAAAAGIQLGP